MTKTLILAGGGHAHMHCLANLEKFVQKGFDVTVIGPSPCHYYSGMGPGMLGQTYRPEEIRFATRHVVEKKGATFIQGKVVRINATARTVILESGKTVTYDVLSCNLGSQVPKQMIRGDMKDIYPVKPIKRLSDAQKQILAVAGEKKITIGIIGGGPSAIEIAGNAWRLTQKSGITPADIKILTNSPLMANHSKAVQRMARFSLEKRGIRIKETSRVQKIETGCVTEASGKTHALDIVFVAIGVTPSPVFTASGIITGPDGGLRVNQFLQSTDFPDIFGGGDCIYFQDDPLDKVGVYAVRQNPILYHNLMAYLEGKNPRPFHSGGGYLEIFNLGDGTGIFHKGPVRFNGRLAFAIKDHIDRKFMKKFQAFE